MAEMAGFSNHQHVYQVPVSELNYILSFQDASLDPARIKLFPALLFFFSCRLFLSLLLSEPCSYNLFIFQSLAGIQHQSKQMYFMERPQKIQVFCPKSTICFIDPRFSSIMSFIWIVDFHPWREPKSSVNLKLSLFVLTFPTPWLAIVETLSYLAAYLPIK